MLYLRNEKHIYKHKNEYIGSIKKHGRNVWEEEDGSIRLC